MASTTRDVCKDKFDIKLLSFDFNCSELKKFLVSQKVDIFTREEIVGTILDAFQRMDYHLKNHARTRST